MPISKLYHKSRYYIQFLKIRNENNVVIFHHSRHEWNGDSDVVISKTKHTKGNDKLIRAFNSFVQANRDIQTHLILFEYGEDVEMSKRLITQLKIEKFITWMLIMPRKEIMVGISPCVIGVGGLDSSYFTYGVVYEFLGMAKPVIHYRNDSLYEGIENDMYPMFSANSSEQVLAHLNSFIKRPD